ncbi:hypothetical protein M9H77_12612 [Catharanthus roseus]|uniref:Uncharacterized protein n=1 Tax=Catharanthus roseus TaxID=4058 RepID=A0ACC0BI37_CATRO|nr:hypothetical protein M9H77_12612 [Catharanthus roseus]
MTPTNKNFIVATAFMRNEQATTYRWVLQAHILSSAVSTGNEPDGNAHEPCVIITDRECSLMPVIKEISTGPISKVMEIRRLVKGVLSLVLLEDPSMTLTSTPKGPRLYCLCTHIQTLLEVHWLSGTWQNNNILLRLSSPERRLILYFYCLMHLQMQDGCPLPPLHVQWQYHYSEQVSGWPEPYFDRIADCNTRYARAYSPGDLIHVNI